MHDQTPPLTVASIGTVRRLQGLVAIGHTQVTLARRLRWRQENFASVINGQLPRVTPAIADSVEMLFLELWAHPVQTAAGERVREVARRRGWVSPLAWDDIDDPAELPNVAGRSLRPADPFDLDGPTIEVTVVARAVRGERTKVTTAERRLAVAALHALHWEDDRMAAAMCVTELTIRSDRTALGLDRNLPAQQAVSA